MLAENFFLDLSPEAWKKKTQAIFEASGKIKSVGDLVPENQLRGYFEMTGEKGKVKVFFTLSPERDPKIQQLDLNAVAP